MPSALHPNLFPCTKCPEHFASRDGQAQHLRDSHHSERPWLCYRCPGAFADRTSYVEHMTSSHRGKAGYCPCQECGARLTSEDIHARHIERDHKEQEGREVPECECGFTNQSCLGLSIHHLQEHSARCGYCGMGFIRTVDLGVHMDRECPKKPKPRVPTPPPTPTQPPSTQSAPSSLPPLPDFALLNRSGLSREDFDPKTTYASTTISKKAYRPCPKEVPDDHLFHADPKMLAFGNLIRLAERHTNREIFEKANAGRSQPVFKSVQSVESRVAAALKFIAQNSNVPLEKVKYDLDQIKVGNGLQVRRGIKRPREDDDMNAALQQLSNPLFAGYPATGYHHAGPSLQKHIKVEGMGYAPPPQPFTGFDLRGDHLGSQASQPAQNPRYDTPAAASGFIKEESP